MGKQVRNMFFLLGLFFLLSGCMSQSGESFYTPPQLSEDYVALQATINQVMSSLGAEYAAPTSGSNVQTIQLHDLDEDGVQESVVAFFRVPSAEKPLKIYFFQQDPETGDYITTWTIEGDGTAIYSIVFENLGGTAAKEIVVSWQISANVRSLAAYSLQPGSEVVELMRSGYTRQAVVDLDRDNEKEIVLFQLDTSENNSHVEMYDYDSGLMLLTSTVPLSMNITEIQSAKLGSLINMVPALFVSSDFGESGGRLTDIIVMSEGALVNLTLDEATGMSTETVRYYKDFKDANGIDINNDGILELPISEPLPLLGETGTQMYMLHWNQYDADGKGQRVCTTFHNYDDSWYLILPEEWRGQFTAARRDSTNSASVSERAVGFYHLSEGEETPEEFLTIYRLTGTNRARRAAIDGRFKIFESSDVIYAAKLSETSWNCGLDSDTLRQLFNRIRVDWSTEN